MALASTLAVAGVLFVVGAVAVASFTERERSRVDEALEARPVLPLLHAVEGPPGPDPLGPAPVPAPGPSLGSPVLRAPGEYVRLIAEDQVLRSVDAPAGLPLPAEPGLRTLSHDGRDYRSLTRPIHGALLEVGTDLGASEERIDGLRRVVVFVGALGVALAGGLSWWLAGLALRPLAGLRAAAAQVSTTRDLSTRLPQDGAPTEVEDLSRGINAMLSRLERSADETEAALEATRRFAADAGHELRTPMTALRARLGALRRHPRLEAQERHATLEEAERDAGRTVRLLDALQTLARGDAGAVLPRERVELSSLVERALDAARSRHPEIDWRLRTLVDELTVDGWPDGLRALVDNLLENAARHGRSAGVVEVGLAADGDAVVLSVDDDGPGVPVGERERIFARFARGDHAREEGSGLGLALVRQQAALHGGEVSVSESRLGGAHFLVRLRPTA